LALETEEGSVSPRRTTIPASASSSSLGPIKGNQQIPSTIGSTIPQSPSVFIKYKFHIFPKYFLVF